MSNEPQLPTPTPTVAITTPEWGCLGMKLVELILPGHDVRPFINGLAEDDCVKPEGMGWINDLYDDERVSFDLIRPRVLDRITVLQRGDDGVISVLVFPKFGTDDDLDGTLVCDEVHPDQLYEAASIFQRVMKMIGYQGATQ